MKQPTRRRFLRDAAGLCVAVPFLPSLARAGEQAPPRFIVFWETGGTINNRSAADHYPAMHPWNDWRPTGTPDAPVLGPIHQDLAAHRDRLLFLSGIDDYAGEDAHELADTASLTARAPSRDDAGAMLATGPSIDQVLAQRLDARWPAPFTSVDLAVPGPHFGEPSHRAVGQPIARERDPRAAFARLFASLDTGLDPAALARVRAERRSVLDGVRGGFRALAGRISAADRPILEAHQDHLRTIERRLAVLDDPQVAAACTPPAVPDGPWSRAVLAPLMVDLMVQSVACGLTHVATLHHPDTIETFLPTPFQRIAPQVDGHALGHTARELDDPASDRAVAWRTEVTANRRWKAGLVARFLDAMTELEPGLERTLVLNTSEFSNAALHLTQDLPIMLAGGLGGLRGGRHLTFSEGGRGPTLQTHVDYRTQWSTHNLYTAILGLFGFDDAHFGDDSAPRRGALPLG